MAKSSCIPAHMGLGGETDKEYKKYLFIYSVTTMSRNKLPFILLFFFNVHTLKGFSLKDSTAIKTDKLEVKCIKCRYVCANEIF